MCTIFLTNTSIRDQKCSVSAVRADRTAAAPTTGSERRCNQIIRALVDHDITLEMHPALNKANVTMPSDPPSQHFCHPFCKGVCCLKTLWRSLAPVRCGFGPAAGPWCDYNLTHEHVDHSCTAKHSCDLRAVSIAVAGQTCHPRLSVNPCRWSGPVELTWSYHSPVQDSCQKQIREFERSEDQDWVSWWVHVDFEWCTTLDRWLDRIRPDCATEFHPRVYY